MAEATAAYGKVRTIRQPSPGSVRSRGDTPRAPRGRWVLRAIVVGYLFLLVIWPVGLVTRATFADGLAPVLDALSQPDVVFAFKLTLVAAFWAVLLNTV